MEWIKTSDRLPDNDRLVWLNFEDGSIHTGCTYTEWDSWCWCIAIEVLFYDPKEKKWIADCEMGDFEPIAWAELPSPPKQD